jgi:hypothetical protein
MLGLGVATLGAGLWSTARGGEGLRLGPPVAFLPGA